MTSGLQWPRDGPGWPHREASRVVSVGPQRWFVQRMGRGPTLLLIHGTGASAHSWRGVMPLLAPHFDVLAIDLPGHAFSGMPAPAQLALPAIARSLGGLLRHLQAVPALLVGHSAGAAVAVRMCLDGQAAPAAVLSLNGALLPLAGLAGQLFGPLARLMAAAPFVPQLFTRRAASPVALRRLIEGTGSKLDAEGVALYARLVRHPGHVQGVLTMMAQWDLQALKRELPALAVPLDLVVGTRDRTVPPRQSHEVLRLLRPSPLSRVTEWPGLGHLAHEERPALAAAHVRDLAQRAGLQGV